MENARLLHEADPDAAEAASIVCVLTVGAALIILFPLVLHRA